MGLTILSLDDRRSGLKLVVRAFAQAARIPLQYTVGAISETMGLHKISLSSYDIQRCCMDEKKEGA